MFSIVIPVWNARKTIRRTVESVFTQTYSVFELVIVDDGSSDGSIAAIADLTDPRLRLLLRPNGGAAAARNTGVQAAEAEWIAFLDGDDVWLPGHLEELDRIRAACPQADLIGTRFLDSDLQGRFDVPAQAAARIGTIRYFEEVGAGRRPFWIGSCAVRRRAWQAVGGFRARVPGDDSDFLVRVALDHEAAASTRRTSVYMHGTGGDIESRIERWRRGGPVTAVVTPGDIASCLDVLLAREKDVGADAMPSGTDAFVNFYVRSHLRTALQVHDITTARTVRRFYRGHCGWRDRLLFGVAALPVPLLRWIYRLARPIRRSLFGIRQPVAAGPDRARVRRLPC
ncbi:glycosyltransferase family 2 protein [Sphingomonas parva]|uniref:Glycosyltransferase family 2 protein n=1 Tax=Sphingomonas parva TaxID=2555898 RepID=A0A4Y8ZRK3_9SPHN|nr:glycosyltransferase family A protein [Sphingomonas parva]TFI58097.1 glycosyltransferase family 2 protein [Sphingomonas parva]